MPRTRVALAKPAAATGVLTVVTAVLYARTPDPFVSQFGWFVIVLGTIGGSMLIAAGIWQSSGREPRTASAVIAILSLGDFACNAAGLRAASLGVLPSPNALLGLTAAASIVLAIVAIGAWWFLRTSTAASRRHVRWAAAVMIAGAVIGGAVVFESMVFRALEPHRAAVEACTAQRSATCVAREEAKPLSTRAFLVGSADSAR